MPLGMLSGEIHPTRTAARIDVQPSGTGGVYEGELGVPHAELSDLLERRRP